MTRSITRRYLGLLGVCSRIRPAAELARLSAQGVTGCISRVISINRMSLPFTS
jgi:hypothetical protein